MKSKAFAIGAVLVMCMTAFAGMCMVSDDSVAGGGSAQNPLTSLSANSPGGTYYLMVGSYVRLYEDDYDEGGEWDVIKNLDSNLNYYLTRTLVSNHWEYSGYLTHPGTYTGTCAHMGSWPNPEIGEYEEEEIDTWSFTIIVVESSPSQPMTSLNKDAWDVMGKTYYVATGSYVTITSVYDEGGSDEFFYEIRGVTSGYGLTCSNNTVSGRITNPGTIYVTGYYMNGLNNGNINCTIVAVGDPVQYTHTVNYAGNGNTGGSTASTVVSDNVNGASSVTLAANGFTKAGYTFTGWLVNGNLYQPGQTVSVGANASVTATAQWSQNTVTASANNISGVSGQSFSNQIGASANNGGSLSYAVKSCTGGNASVNSSGLVTYSAPVVSSTTSYTVTVTVTGTFAQGGNLTQDVSFTVTVDPVLSFTNAATSGTLSVKGA